jgi:hypothetical protein
MIDLSVCVLLLRPWDRSRGELKDENEGMWPPRPLWRVANDALRKPARGRRRAVAGVQRVVETG